MLTQQHVAQWDAIMGIVKLPMEMQKFVAQDLRDEITSGWRWP